jgi:hypothetical protein
MITELLVLILAFPTGLLIAYMTRDELVYGRRWFKILAILAVMGIGVSAFFELKYLAYTFAFMAIVAGISHIKSLEKGFPKRRI